MDPTTTAAISSGTSILEVVPQGAFFTADYLRSLAGQATAVAILVQLVKGVLPAAWLTADRVQRICLLAGVVVHAAVVWQPGMTPIQYTLLALNGIMLAMGAMKAVEYVKGAKKEAPPPAPAGG